MEGTETNTEIKDIVIKAGQTTPVSHDFKSGDFQIYTKVGDEHIDAVVTINEANTGISVAGSRTYTKGAKFLLNPGSYQVKAAPLGTHKNKEAKTFTVEVKQGELITTEIKF